MPTAYSWRASGISARSSQIAEEVGREGGKKNAESVSSTSRDVKRGTRFEHPGFQGHAGRAVETGSLMVILVVL